MARDDWPAMSGTGAMMEDLRRKGIAPRHDEAEQRREIDALMRAQAAKEDAIALRRAAMRPERIIADVLRGKRPRIGIATQRRANEVVAALERAGWRIEKATNELGAPDKGSA